MMGDGGGGKARAEKEEGAEDEERKWESIHDTH